MNTCQSVVKQGWKQRLQIRGWSFDRISVAAAGWLRKETPPWRRPRSGSSCGRASDFHCVVARRQPFAVSPVLPQKHRQQSPRKSTAASFFAGPGCAPDSAPLAATPAVFPQIVHARATGCSKWPHGTGNRPALERDCRTFRHNQKMRAERRAAPPPRPRFSALAMPSTAVSSSGRGELFRSVSKSAAAEFAHGKRA